MCSSNFPFLVPNVKKHIVIINAEEIVINLFSVLFKNQKKIYDY